MGRYTDLTVDELLDLSLDKIRAFFGGRGDGFTIQLDRLERAGNGGVRLIFWLELDNGVRKPLVWQFGPGNDGQITQFSPSSFHGPDADDVAAAARALSIETGAWLDEMRPAVALSGGSEESGPESSSESKWESELGGSETSATSATPDDATAAAGKASEIAAGLGDGEMAPVIEDSAPSVQFTRSAGTMPTGNKIRAYLDEILPPGTPAAVVDAVVRQVVRSLGSPGSVDVREQSEVAMSCVDSGGEPVLRLEIDTAGAAETVDIPLVEEKPGRRTNFGRDPKRSHTGHRREGRKWRDGDSDGDPAAPAGLKVNTEIDRTFDSLERRGVEVSGLRSLVPNETVDEIVLGADAALAKYPWLGLDGIGVATFVQMRRKLPSAREDDVVWTYQESDGRGGVSTRIVFNEVFMSNRELFTAAVAETIGYVADSSDHPGQTAVYYELGRVAYWTHQQRTESRVMDVLVGRCHGRPRGDVDFVPWFESQFSERSINPRTTSFDLNEACPESWATMELAPARATEGHEAIHELMGGHPADQAESTESSREQREKLPDSAPGEGTNRDDETDTRVGGGPEGGASRTDRLGGWSGRDRKMMRGPQGHPDMRRFPENVPPEDGLEGHSEPSADTDVPVTEVASDATMADEQLWSVRVSQAWDPAVEGSLSDRGLTPNQIRAARTAVQFALFAHEGFADVSVGDGATGPVVIVNATDADNNPALTMSFDGSKLSLTLPLVWDSAWASEGRMSLILLADQLLGTPALFALGDPDREYLWNSLAEQEIGSRRAIDGRPAELVMARTNDGVVLELRPTASGNKVLGSYQAVDEGLFVAEADDSSGESGADVGSETDGARAKQQIADSMPDRGSELDPLAVEKDSVRQQILEVMGATEWATPEQIRTVVKLAVVPAAEVMHRTGGAVSVQVVDDGGVHYVSVRISGEGARRGPWAGQLMVATGMTSITLLSMVDSRYPSVRAGCSTA